MNKASEYQSLLLAAQGLMDEPQPTISRYANLSALIKQTLSEISWVGFYLFDGNGLVLGPFQGKVACVHIDLQRGVCGKSAREQQTVVVPNVHEFPGHIACDEGSNSEIVVPIIQNEKLIGVLDLDSYQYHRFDAFDQQQLEVLIRLLIQTL